MSSPVRSSIIVILPFRARESCGIIIRDTVTGLHHQLLRSPWVVTSVGKRGGGEPATASQAEVRSRTVLHGSSSGS
jgi:hypothetical protein